MKFICNGCANWQGDPCILDVGEEQYVSGEQMRCPFKNAERDRHYCKWEKYDDGKVANLQPEVAILPKLTAEVFDRPDCPEWAKYAAVDKCRKAMWYNGKPKVIGSLFWSSQRGESKEITGKYDASDWQNSLIERPAAKLPDWCKVGKWVYYRGYRKIIEVNALRLVLESAHCGDLTVYPEEIGKEVKQARLRPYDEEEMKALLGKAIERHSSAYLVISYAHDDLETTVYIEGKYLSADNLLRDFTINGKPCGVLEHLEDGEWVK